MNAAITKSVLRNSATVSAVCSTGHYAASALSLVPGHRGLHGCIPATQPSQNRSFTSSATSLDWARTWGAPRLKVDEGLPWDILEVDVGNQTDSTHTIIKTAKALGSDVSNSDPAFWKAYQAKNQIKSDIDRDMWHDNDVDFEMLIEGVYFVGGEPEAPLLSMSKGRDESAAGVIGFKGSAQAPPVALYCVELEDPEDKMGG